MEKSVIFDMHGIVFCHSTDLDISKSGELFEQKIMEYSKSVKRFGNAWDKYQKGDLKQALEIEKISVIKGINGDSSELQVYEITGAVGCITSYYEKNYKIAFVSTSEVETSKAILDFLFEKNGINKKWVTEKFDIINMDEYGSKKDVNAWKRVLKTYKNITDIYEDKEKNLQAAGEAARELGSRPRLHLSVND